MVIAVHLEILSIIWFMLARHMDRVYVGNPPAFCPLCLVMRLGTGQPSDDYLHREARSIVSSIENKVLSHAPNVVIDQDISNYWHY